MVHQTPSVKRNLTVVSVDQDAQLRVIRSVEQTLRNAGIRAWLFGGWGLDAQIGRITREHGDVEFWVQSVDAGQSKGVLVQAGANPCPITSIRRWLHLGGRSARNRPTRSTACSQLSPLGYGTAM